KKISQSLPRLFWLAQRQTTRQRSVNTDLLRQREQRVTMTERDDTSPVWVGLGRAIGGSIIFSLPMMMTMEMWWIGFYVDPLRLVCLILLSLPLFYRISTMIGFRNS